MEIETYSPIEVTAEVKKYTLVGDDIYVKRYTNDTPVWYRSLISDIIASDLSVTDINTAIGILENLQTGFNQSITHLQNKDTQIDAELTSLVTKDNQKTAAIANLETTKVDASSAQAIALSTIASYFVDGSAAAWFNSKISTLASQTAVNAQSVSTLVASLDNAEARITESYTTEITNVSDILSQSIGELQTESSAQLRKLQVDDGLVNMGLSDGEITLYVQSQIPTDATDYDIWKAPASSISIDELSGYDPETSYSSADGMFYLYFLNGAWKLATANQAALIESAIKVTDVKDLADGKVRMFSIVPTVPYDTGDMWINGGELYRSTVNRLKTESFNSADWIIATGYTDAINGVQLSVNQQIANLSFTLSNTVDVSAAQYALEMAAFDGRITSEEQTRINAINAESLARANDIAAQVLKAAQLDGKITEEEQTRITAINDVVTAYQLYVDTVKQALIDGEITQAEQNAIDVAALALESAKTELLTGINSSYDDIVSIIGSDGTLQSALSDGLVTFYVGNTEPTDASVYDIWEVDSSQVEIGNFSAASLETMANSSVSIFYHYLGTDRIWYPCTANQNAFILKVKKDIQTESLADQKARIFTVTPYAPYDAGDLWISNEIKFATKHRDTGYDASEWEIFISKTTVDAIEAEALARGQDVTGLTDAYTLYVNTVKQALIDGEITAAEQNAINTAAAALNTTKGLLESSIAAEALARGQDVTGLTDAYTLYVNTVKQALIDGEITAAEQSAINAASAALATAKAEIESNLVTIKSHASVINKVTLPNGSEVTGGWQSYIDYENSVLSNEFSVFADTFKMIDTMLNYAKMTADGLAFYKYGAIEPFKMVAKIDTGVATNNTTVTLSGFYKPPRIIVSQNSILAYDATHSNQSQRWDVRAENINGSIDTGIWTFTPVARLSIAAAISTASLSSAYTGSTDTTYSDTYQTPLDAISIALSGSLNSYRSTGVSGSYQKRKCVCTLQTSPNNSTWTDRNSITVANGADLSSDVFSLYTAITQGQYYYRVKFVYSDDVGTFTTTVSYNYYTRTVTKANYNFNLTNSTPYNSILSYALLANETIVSGTLSYGWTSNEPYANATTADNRYAYISTDGYYSLYSAVRWEYNYCYSSVYGYTSCADTTNQWRITAGVASGTKTLNVTTASKTITVAMLNISSGNFIGTLIDQNLTLQTKIPVTATTTATNSFNSLSASFNLGTTTVLDANGVLNYLAISF